MNSIAYIRCRSDTVAFRILVQKPVKKIHLEDQGNLETILNWMLWGIARESGRYELVHVHDHVISGLCMRDVEP
jgi:hypothetical protein